MRVVGNQSAVFGSRVRVVTTLAILLIAAERIALAETVFEVVATTSAGATDNALASPTGQAETSDGFGIVSVGGRSLYRGARSREMFGLQLMRTQYLVARAGDVTSGTLTLASEINLNAALDFTLGASAMLSETTGIALGDPATVTPEAVLSAPHTYLASAVNQGLAYAPNTRHSYLELLSVSQVRYLGQSEALPTNTAVMGRLRANWSWVRDTLSIEATLTDSYLPFATPGAIGIFAQGTVLMPQLLLGWRRELSLRWSGELQAGALALVNLDGKGVVAPAGRATLEYRDTAWFATLVASQAPVANLYLGQATVSDQVLARLSLPLDKRELVILSGVGSYIFARLTDGQGNLTRGFTQWSAGPSLMVRFAHLPFLGAVEYTLTDQTGDDGTGGGVIPSLVRQTLMVTFGGTFAWGPGTPPLLHGSSEL